MILETLVPSHVMMVMNWVVVKLGPVRVMVLGVELMLCVHKVQCEAWREAYYFTSFDGHLSFTKKNSEHTTTNCGTCFSGQLYTKGYM